MTAARPRRSFILLLAVLTLAAALSAFVLTARAEDEKSGIWGEWIIDREPTEAEPGLRHRVAKKTGAIEYEEIPALVPSPTPTPTPMPTPSPTLEPKPSPTPEPSPEPAPKPQLTKAEAAAVASASGIGVFFALFCVLWVLPIRRVLRADKAGKQKRMREAIEMRAQWRRFK
jgi:outer membrane biosynthesis protein TonB